MTEHIATAPKDGTKILCICSDGKTRYCWWFGCSDVDGYWMTEEVAEPVSWYTVKRLPPSLKKQACALLDVVEKSIDSCSSWDFSIIRRALESLPD